MRLKNQRFRSFESLESRFALAGDITTSIDGSGNLTITGDTDANGFILTQTGNGDFDITGIDAGGTGTAIDGGAANNTVSLTGVTGNITIIMDDGNDIIQLPFFNHDGDMIINAGDDNDSIVLGDAAQASYLVGNLSIRTVEGTDVVTETRINIVGNHDFGAAATNNGSNAANTQSVSISQSNFGSFLWFDFNGRASNFTMINSNGTGTLTVKNHVEQAGVNNGDEDTIVPVNRLLGISLQNSSTVGSLYVDSTSRVTLAVTNCTIVGHSLITTVGTTNTIIISGGSSGGISLATKDSYLTIDGVVHVVESTQDTVTLSNHVVAGSLDLQSNGSLSVNNISAQNARLAATDNADAVIDALNSVFANLTLFLGSTQNPGETGGTASDSQTSNATAANVTNCQVTGALVIDAASRISPLLSNPPLSLINQARATYSISSSLIGVLIMNPVNETGTASPQGAVAGSNSLSFTNTVIGSVSLALPKSNDTLIFNAAYVYGATIVNGGAGSNLMYNYVSTLNNLVKVNFAN